MCGGGRVYVYIYIYIENKLLSSVRGSAPSSSLRDKSSVCNNDILLYPRVCRGVCVEVTKSEEEKEGKFSLVDEVLCEHS